MFYLKYRPRTIAELDNNLVKESVSKILSSKNIPHAFLFVGQKGTGKTSTARVFAKSINCLKNKFSGKGNSAEPCNKCKNCLNIDLSSSTDVIEMDAASNRGIEEMKKVIRESSFLPMSSKYRVFIIDEAHMITAEGFNALLKTLEEPPKSVVFILATTNLEKVPKTIVSRCSIVNFGRAKRSEILGMLKKIVKKESVKTDEELLKLITKHSDHSFRDATKILEELVIQNKLSLEKGQKFLGILSKDSLLEIIEKEELKDTLVWIEEFTQAGGNFKNLIEQLLEELRIQLLLKNNIPIEDGDAELNLSVSEISQLIKLFNEAYNSLRYSPIESLTLEIAVADFYNLRGTKN